MIPELGHFALILALTVALVQGILPLIGAARGMPEWTGLAVPAARAQFLLVVVSYACLTYAFVVNDFSVAYVANNSNLEQPLLYRISGVWGAHEGSLLLWALMLTGWGFAITFMSRSVPSTFSARVLAVTGLVGVGFMLFMLLTSNPFDRLMPVPADGRELNPLLQDPGLAFHPPMLYMGYVGLVVPFAFAVAALLDGRLDAAWVRWARPWTTVAWVFLTFGIALGSWWAYYELGWGGWWFWDPVENASFMPWLIATGLLHSLAVTEKRGAFKSWTVLLAIFGFSLSLLGTFLVRSGVLVSVHAFATDPERGVFILAFLVAVIGSSLILFALRAGAVSGGGRFDLLSRDTLLLANNVLLTVAAASVLIGTLYPLFLDALGFGKISVGPPYFDSVFVPLMLPLLFLMGVGPQTRWKRDRVGRIARTLMPAFVVSVVLAAVWLALAYSIRDVVTGVGLFMAVWIVVTSLQGVAERLRHRSGIRGLRSLPAGFVGMTLAHMGMGVFVVGATLATGYNVEKNLRMAPGDTVEISGYTYRFEGVQQVRRHNYLSREGTVTVTRDGREVAVLHPEKRIYSSQPNNPMTEAAISGGFTRDLYVALGEPLDGGAWAVRVYVKPYVQWLWLGPLMMGIGGLIAASDRRYRVGRQVRETQARRDAPQGAPAAAGGQA